MYWARGGLLGSGCGVWFLANSDGMLDSWGCLVGGGQAVRVFRIGAIGRCGLDSLGVSGSSVRFFLDFRRDFQAGAFGPANHFPKEH